MNARHGRAGARWPRILAGLLGIVVPFVWLWTTVTPSEVTVRIRNALGAEVGTPTDFDWTPGHAPHGYLAASTAAPPPFHEIVAALTPTGAQSEFDLAQAIARDLLRSPDRGGSPIHADALQTYREITGRNRGYCADYVKAFNGLAIAADLPARQWGFAFSGFGSGHTFNEVYDRRLGKWVMVDSFHSLYFVDPSSRVPLSVREVHDRLLELDGARRGVEIVEIVPGGLPFRSVDLAMDYYRRGMAQLWMVFGNPLFDFEQHPLTGRLARVSRAAGQLLGLAMGLYPTIRIYPEGVSERDLRELFRARDEMLIAGFFCLLALVVLVAQLRGLRGRRRPTWGTR
jgi:hypothetical protein